MSSCQIKHQPRVARSPRLQAAAGQGVLKQVRYRLSVDDAAEPIGNTLGEFKVGVARRYSVPINK